tara:strand:+ start:809 stop:1390 length:582 start_codon:yes stop_codon:yes gene_type:complete
MLEISSARPAEIKIQASVQGQQLRNKQLRNKQLLEAAKIGDISEVKNLLARGADVNAKDSEGTTAPASAPAPAPASASAPASVYNDLKLTLLSNAANARSTSQQEILGIIERLQTKTKFPNNNNDIRKLTFIIQSLIENKKTPKTNETSKNIKTIIAQILTTTNPDTRVSEVDYLTRKLFPIENFIFETKNTS